MEDSMIGDMEAERRDAASWVEILLQRDEDANSGLSKSLSDFYVPDLCTLEEYHLYYAFFFILPFVTVKLTVKSQI
jgi:hypothetical protein